MIDTTRLIDPTPSAYSYPLLIKQLLHTPILYAPEQEIVYRDQHRMTYRDLYSRINRLASALAGLGVSPGDTVAVMDWDSHRYLECFFGVPMMGAVLHTVNVRLSPAQLLYTINHAEDDIILIHQDFLPLLAGIKDHIETVKKYVIITEGGPLPESTLEFAGEYEELLAGAEEPYDFPEFDEKTMATLFYTTGTTGDPKGVAYSHRQLVLHTLGMAVAGGAINGPGRFRGDGVYMPLTPMFHVHGWGFPYVATLLGVKQVYPGRYEPEMIVRLVENEGVTFSHCVPTVLHLVLSSEAAGRADLSNWSVVIGGSALTKSLACTAHERGIDIYSGYGMSETCPVLTTTLYDPRELEGDVERQIELKTKAGWPVPLVDLKVVDQAMTPLPFDGRSTGEIVVRAPWATQSYLKDPQGSEKLWAGGWLHTGDIALRDQKGYVTITDRLKDVIKSGGEWISSVDLEDLISQHPAVAEVAVVGVPDEKWGERPLALVVAAPGQEADFDPQEIRTYLTRFVEKGRISKFSLPGRVVVVAEIPKTSVGKLDKKVIRQKEAEGEYA